MSRIGVKKHCLGILLIGTLVCVLIGRGDRVRAEEIWLQDNSRVYGLVKDVTADQGVAVLLPTGDERKIALEDIIAVRFLGRNPLLVPSGTQEFRFVTGGRLRGQIQGNDGNVAMLMTAMAGLVPIDLSRIKGFVALPLAGFSGRKAEELVEGEAGRRSPAVDVVLDTRGSMYPGVIRKLELTQIVLDHEDLLKQVPLRILYVAGVRLADAARDAAKPWAGDVQVRLWGRDESRVQGRIRGIRLGRWLIAPIWESDGGNLLTVDVEEISLVQVLGGRVQYLSQLTPIRVKESTILAPPQPYQMDRSCQGDPISIGSGPAAKRYPWGLGVHADSELTFALNGRFREFRADIGIATQMGGRGSVVFSVLGDGKELFNSGVVRGGSSQNHEAKSGSPATSQPDSDEATNGNAKPIEIVVPVRGVKELTLKVTHAGDLDLGGVANWGSARVLR